jgi:hypothetical protein
VPRTPPTTIPYYAAVGIVAERETDFRVDIPEIRFIRAVELLVAWIREGKLRTYPQTYWREFAGPTGPLGSGIGGFACLETFLSLVDIDRLCSPPTRDEAIRAVIAILGKPGRGGPLHKVFADRVREMCGGKLPSDSGFSDDAIAKAVRRLPNQSD